jgi:hypothetical protein
VRDCPKPKVNREKGRESTESALRRMSGCHKSKLPAKFENFQRFQNKVVSLIFL